METDLSLWKAARRMDQTALVTIFDRYAPDLFNYALHLGNDPLEADNIVGEVFTKFLDQLANGKKFQTNLRSHLYKITYHILGSGSGFLQQEASFDLVDINLKDGDGHHPRAAIPGGQKLLEKLSLVIRNHLSADQRHVIILRYVEGFSLLETAEIIGKEVGDVKAIQSRAIAKLREFLDLEVRA